MAPAPMLRRTFVQLGMVLAGVGAACSTKRRATPLLGDGVTGAGAGGGGGGGGTGGAAPGAPTFPELGALGALGPPNQDGLRLPEGFTARVVARSGELVGASGYVWHGAPDGGATFAVPDGGWIYVSNAELGGLAGGAGALRFDATGALVDAYPILAGTFRNCAGGPTPWGRWLSCEEHPTGQVWECDPTGVAMAVARPALGVFSHEAVAVDPDLGHLYLTEDEPDGCLYRFTPASPFDLSTGSLEVAVGSDVLTWLPVPDPSATTTPTRSQVPEAAKFAGGEGIWWFDGHVFFTTKFDGRVWDLDVASGALRVLYDPTTAPSPILTGVDNVTVSPRGDVLVAEDGGDMQIVVLPPGGGALPIVQLVGHDASEITGPAFDPSYRRLYFSSQRGAEGVSSAGVTYEITAPLG